MRPRFLWLLGPLLLFRLAVGCGSDPKPGEPCRSGLPDFQLLIKAEDGPLPADLLVRVEYGGGDEEYLLEKPGTPVVMFCHHADREGNVLDAGTTTPSGAGGGGEGGAPTIGEVEALFCELWTFGSARIEVETLAYPMTEPFELTKKKDVCTVKEELELTHGDGGA